MAAAVAGPRARCIGTLALCLAPALMLSCSSEQEVMRPTLVPPVMAVEVEGWDIVDRIEATGELVAKDAATVAAQVGGEVTSVACDEGDAVVAGQVLLEIDPERRDLELRQAQAQRAEARAAVTEAKREVARVESLSAQNAVSAAQADEVRTGLELAQARLRAAEAQLGLAERARADSSVRAPFDGLVDERLVSPGEFLTPGSPLVRLVVLDPIEVSFRLAEVDSGRVHLGDRVDVQVSPHPDERFQATVSSISPTIDERTRTLRVKAVLGNADGRLRPGTFARVDLGVAERSGVPMLPEEAVLERSDGSVVFRLVGSDRAERLRVQTGVHREGRVEVGEPIAIGDLVIVRGQVGLIDGARVSLRTADGAETSREQARTEGPE
jgi:RND family efflux transporter MFP subunit